MHAVFKTICSFFHATSVRVKFADFGTNFADYGNFCGTPKQKKACSGLNFYGIRTMDT